jgi:hypothetical protein
VRAHVAAQAQLLARQRSEGSVPDRRKTGQIVDPNPG